MSRTVAVTDNNAIALHLLGFSLAKDGRVGEAIPVYRASLAIAPVNALAWYNLGLAQAGVRDTTGALESFSEAVRLAPSYGEARASLGAELFARQRWREAAEQFDAALRLPLDRGVAADAAFRLGLISAYEGDVAAARARFDAALRFRPDFAEARTNRDRASQLLARR